MPIAGATFGMKVTAMFRPPNNPYIAEYILSTRRVDDGRADAVAARRLVRACPHPRSRAAISVCWSTRSSTNGVRTTFFGRPCETSPLMPKLARQYDCDVYPARCMRLPGNRFRLGIEDKLTLPRDADGKVDVAATAQLLNDVVERWVREDPGQWMWFHKRWKLSPPRANRSIKRTV